MARQTEVSLLMAIQATRVLVQMLRIFNVLLLACSTSVISAKANAQATINVLMSTDAPPYQEAFKGLQQELATQGKQVSYRVLDAKGDPAMASSHASLSNDGLATLTVCIGMLTCEAVQSRQFNNSPVLATMVADEDAMGDVRKSSGVFLNFLPETQLRQHALLFPQLTRVGVLYNIENSGPDIQIARATAQKLGLELIAIQVDSPRQLPMALKNLLRQIDVLWALPDPGVLSPQTAREIMLASFRNRIPLIGSSASWTRSGALYSLERNYVSIGAQVGEMAAQILNGSSVTDITPREPRDIGYTLNRRTAEHMRLRLGASLEALAKEVFK